MLSARMEKPEKYRSIDEMEIQEEIEKLEYMEYAITNIESRGMDHGILRTTTDV